MKNFASIFVLLVAGSALADNSNPVSNAMINGLRVKLGLSLKGNLQIGDVQILDKTMCAKGGRTVIASLILIGDFPRGLDSHRHVAIAQTKVLEKFVASERELVQLDRSPQLSSAILSLDDCAKQSANNVIRPN